MATSSSATSSLASHTDVMERSIILAEVMAEIFTKNYRYVLSKGAISSWTSFPPPKGAELNCEACAYLFKWMAEKRGIRDGLRVVYLRPENGFIVAAAPGLLALGTSEPTIVTDLFRGWEFDNHYRVRDTEQGDKSYDAVFGSCGVLNPGGIAGTVPVPAPQVPSGSMISDYGKKYRIERSVHHPTRTVLIPPMTKDSPIDPQYLLTDANFGLVTQKEMPAKYK